MRNRSETQSALTHYRPWLHWLALFLVVCTFALVTMGGHVTSIEAGLAVPDWPGTFGHFMLIAPLDTWLYAQDTFAEHSHRLIGMLVGIIAIVMAVGLFRLKGQPPVVRYLGLILLILVIIQGCLGGFRVTEQSQFLAFLHGILGQLVLALTVVIAAVTGPRWLEAYRQKRRPFAAKLAVVVMVLIVGQLALGSAVRHSNAALAIPDFPTNYGQWMPPMDQASIDAAVEKYKASGEAPARFAIFGDYKAWQVHLHFTHRLGALVVSAFTLWLVLRVWRRFNGERRVIIPATLLGVLLIFQVVFGVMTVWTGEWASVATAHQTCGAALLATATWLMLRLHRLPVPAEKKKLAPIAAGEATTERLRATSGAI
jgi:cytochrome c oxidase assembly protein subunit 15